MSKKIIIIIILIVSSYVMVTNFMTYAGVDPCDIKCDNCINVKQCEECYNDCYSEYEGK